MDTTEQMRLLERIGKLEIAMRNLEIKNNELEKTLSQLVSRCEQHEQNEKILCEAINTCEKAKNGNIMHFSFI